jgi:hypothetical protein
MSTGSRNRNEVILDFDVLQQIYDFYYQKENWITVCKEVLDNFTFDGGVIISWGEKTKKTKLSEREQGEIRNFLSIALDYKRMFGFAPVKVVKTENLNQRIIIPEFGTVDFSVMLNEQTNEVFMYYTDRNNNTYDRKQAIENNFVYIWPGCGPTYTGEIRSPMLKLMRKYYIQEEYLENSLDADFNSAHPTVFLSIRPDAIKDYQITETDVFAEDDDDAVGPTEKRTYRRSLFSSMLNERKQTQHRGDKFDSQKRKTISDDIYRLGYVKRKRVWDDNVYDLNPDESITHQVTPTSTKEFNKLTQDYEELVCIVMGIPKTYLVRSRVSFKGEILQADRLIQQQVTACRTDAKLFFQESYNWANEHIDMNSIAKMIYDNSSDDVKTDSDKKALIKRFKTIKKIINGDRNSIEFLKDPFGGDIPLKEMHEIYTAGAISDVEYISALRARLNLDPKNFDYAKFKKHQEELNNAGNNTSKGNKETNNKKGIEKDNNSSKPKKKEKEK